MLTIIMYVVLATEALLSIACASWLATLYIKNSAYNRDVYLIVATLSTIGLAISLIFHPYAYLSLVALTQTILCLFTINYVKYNSSKWFANMIKALLLALTCFVITFNNIVVYHLFVVIELCFTLFYVVINGNSIKTKIFNIIENFLVLGVIESYWFMKPSSVSPNPKIAFHLMMYTAIITYHAFTRARRLKKMYD